MPVATPGGRTVMGRDWTGENSKMQRLVIPHRRGTPVFFGKSAQGEERKVDELDTKNERVGK
jgi:hypothetical protein